MATGLNFLKSYFLASESTTTGANPGNILTTAKVRSSKILGCALLKMVWTFPTAPSLQHTLQLLRSD